METSLIVLIYLLIACAAAIAVLLPTALILLFIEWRRDR